MPFGVVSGVGRWMDVLDRGGHCRRGWAVLGLNLVRPIVTNGDLGDAALPRLLWEVLAICCKRRTELTYTYLQH